MNLRARWLSAVAAAILLIIGLAEPLHLRDYIHQPRFLPPSWQVIYLILPNGWDWVYPALWTLAGVISLAGFRWLGALRWGFRLSALLFLSWGIAGIPAITLHLGGNIQGAAANIFTAGLAWLASYYVGVGDRGDRINEQVVRLAEKVREANGHEPE